MRVTPRRLLPLALLASLAAAAFAVDLHHYLTLDALRDNRQSLQAAVADNFALTALAYAALYAVAVAVSFPGATVLTVTGGFLFGAVIGGTLAVAAATIGATLVFLAARTVLGDSLRRRAGPFLRRMEDGFASNAFSYLLFLRLVPAFPFWAVNLVPALAGLRLPVFAAATVIGIIPGTFVFAAFGAGLGDLFAAGADIRLSDVLSPTMIIAFSGLGALALLPVVIRKWRGG